MKVSSQARSNAAYKWPPQQWTALVRAPMIHRTLKHYRITARRGRHGEVYLAENTKLDRKVALQILPADVATNRDRMERFVHETPTVRGVCA